MSGLEVAGLVLGSIPLVISALEHYKEGLRSVQIWRKYAREINSLTRQLRMQHNILTNVCETLLEDLGLGSRVDAMIEAPFGPMWQDADTRQKLRRRLHRDFNLFEDTVKDMGEAIDEVKKKLDLGPDGKVKWVDAGSWKREVKRALFTFSRGQYQEYLQTLKDGNHCLESLTRHNMDLEPKRKSRLQIRFFNLLRLVSRNIYLALRSSLSCRCSHGLNFELTTPNLNRELRDEDEQIVSDLLFRIGLSAGPATNTSWKEVLLRPYVAPKLAVASSSPAISPGTPQTGKKSVKFSQVLGTTGGHQLQSVTITQTQTHLVNFTASILPHMMTNLKTDATDCPPQPITEQITDICSSISMESGETGLGVPSCRGLISNYTTAQFSKFEVHSSLVQKHDVWYIITLNDILQCEDDSLANLVYTKRIRMAYAVSHAILQLSETPWLSDVPSSADIVFVGRNGSINYDQVFMARDIFQAPKQTNMGNTSGAPRIRNHTLFALGIILIEIMLQKPFAALRKMTMPRNEESIPDARLDVEAARSLATRISNEFGTTFGSAIQRCIDCSFNCESSSLDDENFRQEFYSGVVALLEENVKNAGLLY